MDTLDDLGDTGLDTGLITKIGDVLAGLADDDAGLLGGDEGTEGQGSVGIETFDFLVLEIVLVLGLEQGVVAGVVGLSSEVVIVFGERHCG